MDIEELKKEKARAERELAVEISIILTRFHNNTGEFIRSASVYMGRISTIGRPEDEYFVDRVSCEIDL